MAHTFDITTDRGKVRLGLADTQAKTATFSDAEIDYFLTEGGTVDAAIVMGLQVQARAAAMKGDVTRANAIRDQLAALGGDLPTVITGEGNSLPTDDAYEAP